MEILSRMFASWIFVIYHLFVSFQFTATQDDCSPVYVRWARVRLNLTARVAGPYSLDNCTKSCNKGDNPARPGFPIECSGFNHKQGANSLSHDCQLFQRDQLLNVDGHVEADDRYAFYWKYCAKTKKVCKSLYQFDFYIDRFMDSSEIQRTINTDKVEDCLSRCLDETEFTCRSISFNRTANVCSLSPQSQISKPGYLRVNNNPNYRIDYYENNCYNVSESFTFHHDCRDNGIVVSVESKFQYTGALYGLYDFFTCRIEPKNETRFSLFFPYSSYSKNCTDSFSEKESNHVLDVVLSTDGMEPLYFLTDQDLLYKAKCPLNNAFSTGQLPSPSTIGATVVFLAPAITTTTPQSESSSLSTTLLSSTQSSESIPPITSSSYPSSIHSSILTGSSGDDYKTTLQHYKKPFVTLPVIDFTPNVEKADSDDVIIPNKGNKITVVLKYPRNDLFHETDEISSLFETATERSSISPSSLSTFTENTSSKSTSTESTSSESTSIETTSSASTKSSSMSASTETTFTTTIPTTSAITSKFTTITTIPTTTTITTVPTTITTTTIPTTTTSESTTVELSTQKALQRFTDIIHLESKIDVDNSVQFVAGDHISHITKSHAVLNSSTNEKPTSTISSRSSSTWSSTARSTATSFETTKQSTTGTTTSTTEPSTNTRATSDTAAPSTERNSRFDPFGGGGQSSDLPSTATTSATATATASITTTVPTTTSRNKFGTEFSLDRTTSQPTSTSSQTKSMLTNATTTLATTTAPQKVLFDVFHNNQPVNAVVVGSRITLSFASGLGVQASYISLVGCQVEPVNSPYSWERDPLQIVKNGCQADGVGLVCPPTRTEFGVKVEMEAFRYTTTSEVLYSCLVRVCAFNPCPQPFCNSVDGCDSPNAALPVLINSRGRRKRQQIPVPSSFSNLGPSFQVPGAFQQNLLGSAGIQQNQLASAGVQPNLGSAGDIVVSKKLVVVNSENELQYFLRTGNVPTAGASFNSFVGR